MRLCNSPHPFRKKLSELVRGLEFARAFIDYLLVVSKDIFVNDYEPSKEVFSTWLGSWHKFYATKTNFFRDELEYLRYLFNRKG
jgi:hypothetical protein